MVVYDLKRLVSFIIVFFVLFDLTLSVTWAQSTEEILQQMQRQINELQQRVTDLESQNAQLKNQLSNEPVSAVTPVGNYSAEQSQNIQPTQPVPNSHSALSNIPTVQSNYPIDIYGRLEFNASYDDSRTDQGNYNRWVLPETTNNNDDQFNTTATRTRIGVKLEGPDVYTANTSGLIEGDFFGGGDDNKSRFRMRHAFMQLIYPEHNLILLAGQTYDMFSPLFPPTINFTTGYWVGNLGFRRPQFRVTKNWHTQDDSIFTLTGGFSRTIGELSGFDPGDTGEDSGFPTLQGRLAFTTPLWLDKSATLGVSGHWGQEEYDFDVFGNNRDYNSWSANIDLTLPLTQSIKFTSEAWVGENLDTYVGGINQGVNTITMDEVGAWGGWSALSFGPYNDWIFNLGATLDNPENDDLNAGDRSRNVSYFTNSIWQMNEALQIGLELSYWETNYLSNNDGDSYRIQSSIKYKF